MVINDILNWSEGLHEWQKDALRRVCAKDELDSSDIDELTDQIKQKAGFSINVQPSIPITKSHLGSSVSNANLALKEIKNVQNVNALISETTLKFKPDGLTVVYGRNGSGKTGFIRILRHACRTRINDPKKLKILSNVYGSDTSMPKEAEIVIAANGVDKTLKWEENKPAIDDLLQATVFDTQAANLYVDEGNQIRFLPFGLDLPYQLNSICVQIAKNLKEDKANLESQLSLTDISRFPLGETTGNKFYQSLSGETTDVRIDSECKFLKNSEDRLKQIIGVLSSNKEKITDIEALIKWCSSLKKDLQEYSSILSENSIEKLKSFYKSYSDAEKAAEFAADGAFKNEPVSGVGSNTWEKLWLAAKAFSEQEAYPKKDFPVIATEEDDPKCVLCHQDLNDETKERLEKFNTFVTGKLSEELHIAKNKWEKFCEEINDAKLLSNENDDIHLKQIKERSEELSNSINLWVKAAESQMSLVKSFISKKEDQKYSTLSKAPIEALDAFINTLEKEKSQLTASFDDSERQKLEEEKSNLESIKILSEEIDQIKKRRDLLKEISLVKNAIGLTSTANITKKANELIDTHLTTLVDNKFEEERNNLSIDHLNIKLKRESDRSGANFKTSTEADIKCNASDVLSEGEQKALALAGFLTETHIISPNGPIILDDPVSSLDRERSLKVAERLAKESKGRQVIIFTHDIVFYNQVCGEAVKIGLEPECIRIFSSNKESGKIDPDGEPWKGKSVQARFNTLKDKYIGVKKLYGVSPSKYEYEIKQLYSRLRDTYERCVEEIIFNGVVVRYSDQVQTQKLRYIDFSDELAKMFDEGMTRANTYSHDNPSAESVTCPTPDEFEADLLHFEGLLENLKVTYKNCEKRRA